MLAKALKYKLIVKLDIHKNINAYIKVWHLPFYISEISFNPILAPTESLKAYLHVCPVISSNVENGSINSQISIICSCLPGEEEELYHMIGLTTKLETNNHTKNLPVLYRL